MARFAAREGPLVGFTLLSQTAVGAFWMLAAGELVIAPKSAWSGERVVTESSLLAVAGTLAVAALLSFFHLGRPLRAPSALNNVRRSWLSREILAELVFGYLVVFSVFFVPQAGSPRPTQRILLVLASAAGLVFLFSMARIYMLATVPAWRSLYTPLSFFLSSVLLGPLAAVVAHRSLLDLDRSFLAFEYVAIIAAIVAVLLSVATMLLFTPTTGFLGPKTPTLLALPARRIYPVLFIRMAFFSAAVLCLFLAGRDVTWGRETVRWPALALACLGASEVAGRALFYALYSRIGV
jgi:anaerobic dimethyl sulfoxide reductase subunit C (anchor subunit)